MAFDRDAAKAEGYTDDEINAYLQAEAAKNKETPVAVDPGEPPPPTTVIPQVQTGLLTPSGGVTTGMAVGLGAAGVGLPAAALYAGKKIFSPAVQSGAELAQRGVGAMESANEIARQTEQRIAANQAAKAAGQAIRPVAPTGGGVYAGQGANVPTAPVVPQGMAPIAENPGVMAQLRAFAANKVLPMAGNLARGSVAPAMLFHSGELNANEDEELRRRRMMQPTITR